MQPVDFKITITGTTKNTAELAKQTALFTRQIRANPPTIDYTDPEPPLPFAKP